MTRVHRLVPRRHVRGALSGEGARRFAGRWHHAGTRVVYAASTLSLAALELLVHVDSDLAPARLVRIAIEIPAGMTVRRVARRELPRGWRALPAPEATQQIGSAWARAGREVALFVPSAVVPEEDNVLLNPAHPDFGALRVLAPDPFTLDPRLRRA